MSTTTTSLQESLQVIAKKSGKTLAEVKDEYEKALQTLPSTLSDAQKIKYALKKTNAVLAVNTRSSAIAYEALIISAEPTRDVMKNIRQAALEYYSKDPVGAKAAGVADVVNGKVVVLDDRRKLPDGSDNPKFGKPRPESILVREAIIAVRSPQEKKFTRGKLTLWNEKTGLSLPRNKLVSFKALGGFNQATGEVELKSGKDTVIEPKIDLPREEVIKIIDDVFVDKYIALGDIEDNITKIKDYVLTEGTVKFNPTIASDNETSHRFVLDDDSLPAEHPPVTVWVPNEQRGSIQFGKGSIVTVIARPAMRPGWDSKTKTKTTELQLQLNAIAVFGRPGLTTPINTQDDEF